MAMMVSLSIIITVVALYSRDVSGFDLFSCYNMVPPGITEAPQSSPSPYAVKVSPAVYQDGVPMTVTIGSIDGAATFTDFLIEALCVTCARTAIPVGTFTNIPAGAQMLPCFSAGAAVMATTNSEKKSVTLQWTPPSNFNGVVIMRASIVQSGSVWWGDIASRALERQEAAVWHKNIVHQGVKEKAFVVKRQAESNTTMPLGSIPDFDAAQRRTTTVAPGAAAPLKISVFVNLLAFAIALYA